MGELGDFLRDKREEEKLPIRKLAGEAKISFGYLAKLERGECKTLSPEKVEKIAHALHLDSSGKKQLFLLAGSSMAMTFVEKVRGENPPPAFWEGVSEQVAKQRKES